MDSFIVYTQIGELVMYFLYFCLNERSQIKFNSIIFQEI